MTTPTPAPAPDPSPVIATIESDEETIATHVAAALAAVGGALALVHPGFHVPSIVEACVVPVSWAAAAGLEVYNLVTKRKLKAAVIDLVSQLASK